MGKISISISGCFRPWGDLVSRIRGELWNKGIAKNLLVRDHSITSDILWPAVAMYIDREEYSYE